MYIYNIIYNPASNRYNISTKHHKVENLNSVAQYH